MRTTTPTATCTRGHVHVSAYAALECSARRTIATATSYAPLTQAERTAVTSLPCSA